jgi:hypothetical protein
MMATDTPGRDIEKDAEGEEEATHYEQRGKFMTEALINSKGGGNSSKWDLESTHL